MLAQIQELMAKVPFEPFIIHTSGGKEYRVSSLDHISISPKGTRVNIWFDNDGGVWLSLLHVTAVEVEPIMA